MPDSSRLSRPGNCLGRTCLQWSADGELAALDLQLVIERLAQVDQALAALQQDPANLRPFPTSHCRAI